MNYGVSSVSTVANQLLELGAELREFGRTSTCLDVVFVNW